MTGGTAWRKRLPHKNHLPISALGRRVSDFRLWFTYN